MPCNGVLYQKTSNQVNLVLLVKKICLFHNRQAYLYFLLYQIQAGDTHDGNQSRVLLLAHNPPL